MLRALIREAVESATPMITVGDVGDSRNNKGQENKEQTETIYGARLEGRNGWREVLKLINEAKVEGVEREVERHCTG